MSLSDWTVGFTLYHLRTVVYTAVTCVAIFAVWYTGHEATARLNRVQIENCQQATQLTGAVNNLHGSLKKFLIAARDVRLRSPHTKANLQAAQDYQQILDHIQLVDPPVCQQP